MGGGVLAKTLKWPSSLAEQTRKVREKRNEESFLILLFGLAVFGTGYLLYLCKISWAHWIGLVGIVIAVAGLAGFSSPSDREKTLVSGGIGEMVVAQTLDTLPDEWFIINDVILQGAQIDHIVIGPPGIFCIETKNWNTAGTDKHGNWYKYQYGQWHLIQENPARQNMGHIRAIKDALGKECPYINSLVVLAAYPNGYFSIAERTVQPGNTLICSPGELCGYLVGWPGKRLLSEEAAARIADMIMNKAEENAVHNNNISAPKA